MKAFEGNGVRGAAFEQARDLVAAIPGEFYMMKDERTIGCPDCRDQCGIYLEISEDKLIRKIFLDPEVKGESGEVMKFIDDVHRTIGAIDKRE